MTVVDTFNVMSCLSSVETSARRQSLLGDEGKASEEEQEQSIADLLVDQIEFANVILLNKVDLVPGETEEQGSNSIDIFFLPRIRPRTWPKLCLESRDMSKLVVP